MPGQKVSCPLEPSLACWGLRRFPEHPQDPAPNSSGLCCAVPSGAGHRGSRLLFSPAPRGSVSDHCCAQRPRELSMPLGAWLPAHLAPGPHHPLRARLRVAEPRAVGPQRLLAEARLRAGHQALLLATATGLGALGAGRAWGGVRAQPGPKPPPPAPPPQTPRPHLPPGGGVPAEAGLGPAGLAGWWRCRPCLAVEGPEWPEVPCVHTLHVPHRGASATAAGALGAEGQVCGQTTV